MAPFKSYIICATPRSGSTLLCDLLGATGVSGRPHSYFRRQSIPGFARDLAVSHAGGYEDADFSRRYLAAILKEGRGGTGIFGLRLMWDSVGELSARLGRLFPALASDAARFERAFGTALFIHLSREDKAAQAVSLLKADQTGLWHVNPDGSERDRSAPPAEAVYDRAAIKRLVDALSAQDAAWLQWFAGHRIEPVRLTYEALSQDPRRAVRTVLSALGLDPDLAYSVVPKTAKLANLRSADWVSRFYADEGREQG